MKIVRKLMWMLCLPLASAFGQSTTSTELKMVDFSDVELDIQLVAKDFTLQEQYADGFLKVREEANIQFILSNFGSDAAKNVKIAINEINGLQGMEYPQEIVIPELPARVSKLVKVKINVGDYVDKGIASFQIWVGERNAKNKPYYQSVSTDRNTPAPSFNWYNLQAVDGKVFSASTLLDFCLFSTHPVRSLRATLNGNVLAIDENSFIIKQSGGCDHYINQMVSLENGLNVLRLEMEDNQGNIHTEIKAMELVNEKRVALIIGNKNYEIGPLGNTINDANDIADKLALKGFEVIRVIDGNRDQVKEGIRSFNSKLEKDGIGLFYYAGHGVQVDGENYLVPIGARLEVKAEVADECIPASLVLRTLEYADNRLNIIIMDACRNNPFKSFSRGLGSEGLIKMDAPKGSILCYATAPGQTASDGNGRNGLYTETLLQYLDQPGVNILELFNKVSNDVSNKTGGKQVPWISFSNLGNFYFSN